MNKQEFKQALKLAMSDADLVGIAKPDNYPRCSVTLNDEYTEKFCQKYWDLLSAFVEDKPIVTLSQVALNIRHNAHYMNGDWDQEQLQQMSKQSKNWELIEPDISQVTPGQAIAIVGELTERFNLPIETSKLDWRHNQSIPEDSY